MDTIQGWVDATRDWVDPLYGIMAVVALGLLLIWSLNRPATTRDHRVQGGHYLGKITPKTLPKMLQDAPLPPEETPPADAPPPPADADPGASAEDDPIRRLRRQRQQEPPRRGR